MSRFSGGAESYGANPATKTQLHAKNKGVARAAKTQRCEEAIERHLALIESGLQINIEIDGVRTQRPPAPLFIFDRRENWPAYEPTYADKLATTAHAKGGDK